MNGKELRLVVLTVAGTAAGILLVVGVVLFWMTRADAPTLAEEGTVAVATSPTKIPTRVEYRDDLAFFDLVSGSPAIWYHKLSDGSYDLFDAPGFHPTYGKEAPLQTVTPMIVGDIKAYFENVRQPVRQAAARPVLRPAPRRQAAPQLVVAPREQVSQVSPAPVARSAMIPAGTRLDVILGQRLSTETNQVGDTFEATLVRPVVISGETVLEQGATVTGRITNLQRPGRTTGVAKLTLTLIGVYASGENTVSLKTIPLAMEGKTTRGEDARDVGIGTGIGTAVGAIFGGRRGAATGAVAGAGGGTAVVLATRGEDLVLAPERELTFTLSTNADVR